MTRTLVVLGLAVLSGCGGRARVVMRDGYGGVLALEGRQDKARRSAQELIGEHCGAAGAVIVREEEVPVGTRVTVADRSRRTTEAVETYDGVELESQRSGNAVVNSSTVTELRITYRCGTAPAVVVSAAPVVAPAPPAVAAPSVEAPIVENGPATATTTVTVDAP
jgi:hypothetical protein